MLYHLHLDAFFPLGTYPEKRFRAIAELRDDRAPLDLLDLDGICAVLSGNFYVSCLPNELPIIPVEFRTVFCPNFPDGELGRVVVAGVFSLTIRCIVLCCCTRRRRSENDPRGTGGGAA